MAATSGLTVAILDLGHRTNLKVEPSTCIPFEGSSSKGYRDIGHFRFDDGHLGLGHRTKLRVEPSIYIPNLKVLTFFNLFKAY